MTDAEKLRLLADWFDGQNPSRPPGDEVQRDLRRIANLLEPIEPQHSAQRMIEEEQALDALLQAMRRKLSANRAKGSWRELDLTVLLDGLCVEVGELREAIEDTSDGGHIIDEAADVANFAAMIVDVVYEGAILRPQPETEDERWAKRVQLLEERNRRAAAVLRGEDDR